MRHGKLRYAWVTAVPLTWDLVITMTASWQNVFSGDPRVGYFTQAGVYPDAQAAGEPLAPAQNQDQMDQVFFNSTLNGILQAVFALLTLVVAAHAAVVIAKAIRSRGLPTTEEPAVPSNIVEPAGLFATAEEKRAMAEHDRLVGAGAGTHGTADGGSAGNRSRPAPPSSGGCCATCTGTSRSSPARRGGTSTWPTARSTGTRR